jgi:hypothetical protein
VATNATAAEGGLSMGIYIKNIEMPMKYPVTVTIFPDGISVVKTISGKRFTATAVPVPPHGRLIDEDALMKQIEHDTPLSAAFEKTMRRYLHNAPTIIPAEEGET